MFQLHFLKMHDRKERKGRNYELRRKMEVKMKREVKKKGTEGSEGAVMRQMKEKLEEERRKKMKI